MRKQWIKKESLYHKPFYKQKLKMTMLLVLLLGVAFFAYQVFSVNQLQLSAASTPHQQQQQQSQQAHAQSHQLDQTPAKQLINVVAGDGPAANNGSGPARAQHESAGLLATAAISAADRLALLAAGRGIRDRDLAAYAPTADRTFRCLRSGEVFNEFKVNDDYCDCADGSDEPATNACAGGLFWCAHRKRHPRAGIDRQQSIPNSRINDGICDCCDGSDEWLPHRRRDGQPAKCPQRCE